MKENQRHIRSWSMTVSRSLLALIFVSAVAAASCKQSDQSAGGSEKSEVGGIVTAPEFEFQDLQGKVRSLKDFKGKTIMLNLWATWCVPCVAEMASLERLYKLSKDKNFEIIAVTVDPDVNLERVKKFVKDQGISFTILRDPEISLPPRYGVGGFPESFFISRDGSFLRFVEPDAGEASEGEIRVVGDRAWDSQTFVKAVGDLIQKDQGTSVSK